MRGQRGGPRVRVLAPSTYIDGLRDRKWDTLGEIARSYAEKSLPPGSLAHRNERAEPDDRRRDGATVAQEPINRAPYQLVEYLPSWQGFASSSPVRTVAARHCDAGRLRPLSNQRV
jgi:hypothetical protein